jgi:hypothetical protein
MCFHLFQSLKLWKRFSLTTKKNGLMKWIYEPVKYEHIKQQLIGGFGKWD